MAIVKSFHFDGRRECGLGGGWRLTKPARIGVGAMPAARSFGNAVRVAAMAQISTAPIM
jgi:hypothetical protein